MTVLGDLNVYQIGLPPRRIDLIRVDFIGRDTFVRNKLATGRPQDLADAERLKR